MIKKGIWFCLLFLCCFDCQIFGEGRVSGWIQKIDDQMEMRQDLSAKVALTQQRVSEGVKVYDMVYFRKDTDDSFLMTFSSPESERGNGYLKVGENFWMYRRNTRTFQHIARDESIGGTEANADDFEKRKLTELYQPTRGEKGEDIFTEETLGSISVYQFELTAVVKDVKYPKKRYWIRKDNLLPLKEQNYSLSGTLMQTTYYLKYSPIETRFFPTKVLYIDEFEKGNKTLMEISGISLKPLDKTLFTKATLETLSK